MTNQAVIKEKKLPSVKIQTLAAITATVGAVVLPQLFHLIGKISGSGAAVGTIFLPMYLPIVLVGLLAGPYAGLAAGLAAPFLSFALSGMPTVTMLPIIASEVAASGLFAGLFGYTKMPAVLKVLATQVAAKAIRAAATFIMIYAFGSKALTLSGIYMSAVKGLPGIILQLVLIPLIVYRVTEGKKNEN